MKFIVNSLTKCVPRVGVINEIQRLPGIELETPLAFLYTKGGSIPHVTREVLKLITKETHCIQVPLATAFTFPQSLADTNLTLSEFIGLNDYLVYVTVQDPGNITPSGHHQQFSIPIWTRTGKKYLTPENYMSIIESFKPDLYCLLSDGDTNKASSKKRISKALDNTSSFLRECLQRHRKSVHLRNSMIVAPVVGGYCLKSRKHYIEELMEVKEEFGAFAISGLHNNGPEMELMAFEEVQPVVKQVIENLPADKMRIVEGCWNPVNVICLVRMGVDMFDTSYLNLVTERSAALTFDFLGQKCDQNQNDRFYEINLRDTKYQEEFSPLLTGCTCLTCTKYTRSYIHHLIMVQELLGSVLLSIHNIHHYLEFFKKLRQSIKDGTLDELERLIKSQFDEQYVMTAV